MAAPPVSVIVVTKNEEARIEMCLAALAEFDDVWVVDSGSTDRTKALAETAGAQVVNFEWNGQYPKKRQWCLGTLALKYDWVFFVDADEIVTPDLVEEIVGLDYEAAGYFVRGRYVFEGRALKYGLQNNKLCLIDRRRMAFPVVDDLDLPGMGEIEGHYQPVLRDPPPSLRGATRRSNPSLVMSESARDRLPRRFQRLAMTKEKKIGQLKSYILHNAFEGGEAWGSFTNGQSACSAFGNERSAWDVRHERYAAWERGMNERGAWPEDARLAKRVFKTLPFQGLVAFLHSYVLKLGFLDGAAGFRFAQTRWRYYRMI